MFPDGKRFNELDMKQYQLPDSSLQIPAEVMKGLDIPGYSWLYLTLPDAAIPDRNFIFIAGETDRTKAGGARSAYQAERQAGGDQGKTSGGKQLSFEGKKKVNVDMATAVPFRIPRVLLTNAHSLQNKVEDLNNRLTTDKAIQSCELMCFTETWLTEPTEVGVRGFREKHYPRDPQKTGKKRGGGLGVLIKHGVRAEIIGHKQTPNYQRVVFIYETQNHPEGRPPFIFMLVYIQPQAQRRLTRRRVEKYYCKALERSNGAPVFILGDFNWYDNFLKNSNILEQYVTCPTRRNRILDKCYGNIPQAYTSHCRAPLRSSHNTQSDHNVILLTSAKENCSHSQVSLGG